MGQSDDVLRARSVSTLIRFVMSEIEKQEPPGLGLTMIEVRTVRTILCTLLAKNYLPGEQSRIAKGVISKIDKANMGEQN